MNQHFLEARTQIVRLIRRFFDEQGFLEVHTPRLVGLPGQEPYLDPVWTTITQHESCNTHHQSVSSPITVHGSLITSPEYSMKKMLGAGMDKIYDLGPCFRDNEPRDGSHDVEFLLLEWYRRNAGLEELMADAEAMIRFVSNQLSPVTRHPSPPSFRRMTVSESLRMYANLDLEPLLENRDALAEVVRAHGHTVALEDAWDDLFFKIFLAEVEPKLGDAPTFLHHYPACMAALARRDPHDPRFSLRVELYMDGMELANGFAELSDPVEQRRRFEEEIALRKKLGKKTWPIDERLLDALPNMGNAAGMAFGVDRLVMLLTGATSINDIMPIPMTERFENKSDAR